MSQNIMFTSVAVTPINHMLHGESWARELLQAYAGSTACIRNFPFPNVIFTIQDNGEILATSDEPSPDATLTLTADLIPRLLVNDAAAYDSIKISGDDGLANALLEVGKNLRWDIAQDLSKIIGDIPAHRVVQAGENIIHWHTDNAHKLASALAEYWTEEQPMLANAVYVNGFIHEVDALANDVEQLEKRIQKLMNKIK